jgi:chitodextrinase
VAIAVVTAGCSVQGNGGPTVDSVASTSAAYALEGTVSGLTSSGLVLANGSNTVSVAANASSFQLSTSVAYASEYSITVADQPRGLTCSVVNGAGMMPASTVTNVTVTCLPNTYSLGGTASGLTAPGLFLSNNGALLEIESGASTFAFESGLSAGASYSVMVSTQPSGLNCSLKNASGTMPQGNVTDLSLTCLANAYTLSGSISGVTSAGLVLANNGIALPVTPGASSFSFGAVLRAGSSYSVTVQNTPTGLTCSVANGAGAVGTANVTNVVVSCAPSSNTQGNTTSGLVYQCNDPGAAGRMAVDTNSLGVAVTMPECTNMVAVPLAGATLTLQRWHPGDLADPNAVWQLLSALPAGWSIWTPGGWETLSQIQSGTTPPSVPSGLTATAQSATSVALNWAPSTDSGGPGVSGYTIYRNGSSVGTTSTTSFTDTGLAGSTLYLYDVAAFDTNSVASAQSTPVSVTTPFATASSGQVYQCNDPGAAGRIAVDTNSLSLAVTMPDCSNMIAVSLASATLTLQRWHPGDLTDPDAIWQSLSSLPAGWSIWTPDGWQTLLQLQSGTPPTPPTVPTGLNAAPESSSTIELTWTASTDVGGPGLVGYTVYRNGSSIGTTPSASYTDGSLTPGTQYTYTVAAYDTDSDASAQTALVSATTLTDSASTGLVYQCNDAGATGRIAVDANSLGEAVTMPNCSNMVAVPLGSATLTLQRWHPGDLTDPNAIWQLESSLPAGWSVWTPSGWETVSQVQTGTTPTVPSSLVATAESGSTIQLTWAASTDSGGPGVAGYSVYRNGSSVGTSTSPTYTDTSLNPSTPYSYTVAAYDTNSNSSAQSASVAATTLTASVSTGQVYQCNDSGASGRIAVDANSLGQAVTMPNCINMVAVPLASATLTLQRWHPGDLTDPDAIWQSPGSLPAGWSMWTPAGWETQSQVAAGTPPTLPTVPTGLVAATQGNSSVLLTWTASTDNGGPGIGGYTIYRNGSSVGTTALTSYTDMGLAAGAPYTYTVAAFDTAFNASAQSAPAYAMTTTSRSWTMEGGSAGRYSTGTYGTQGISAPGNAPGSRYQAGTWTDPAGNFWLFGGWGADSTGTDTRLNDVWMYSPSIQQWTWEAGSSTGNAYPSWGALGVAAGSNTPGGRDTFVSWADASGNFYMFGGDTLGVEWVLCNDLWKYNITTGLWTWLNGPTTCSLGPTPISNPAYSGWETTAANVSVFGTQSVAAAGNLPANRRAAASWTDASGNLWMFGGISYVNYGPYTNNGVPEGFVYLNDLWMFSPASGLWTWMGGSQTPNSAGVYGTQGVGSTSNIPSAREVISGTTWADKQGNLWLFGGVSPSSSLPGGNNDLWKYNISSGQWTWVSGSNGSGGTGAGAAGVYGTEGVAAPTNVPGARYLSASWIDSSGTLWMWGGGQWQGDDGEASNGFTVNYDDLWTYVPSTNLWTWVNGTQNTQVAGTCGALGVAATTNVPGARNSALSWMDSSGSLWLFGGEGLDCSGNQGLLGDFWKY